MSLFRSPVAWLALWAAILAGCGKSVEHEHEPGSMGGFIVSVGPDHYHAEIVLEQGGTIKIFMRGQDDSQVIDVERQQLTAYVRQTSEAKSIRVDLEAEPQAGDAEGRTSLFVGSLPENIAYSSLVVAIPSISINGHRYRFHFTTAVDEHNPLMPAKVTDEDERKLYLTPGGLYTAADIQANGSTTASQKYASFKSVHDMHPQPGDRICPVTRTKANAECVWIIGGERHEFCCPPCIDEFMKLAKESPKQVKRSGDYVQQ